VDNEENLGLFLMLSYRNA